MLHPRKVWEEGVPTARGEESAGPRPNAVSEAQIPDVRLEWMSSSFCAEDL